MARYMRTDLGVGHTRLRPPVVVTPAALPLYDQRTIRTAYKITVRRQSPAEVNRHFARYRLGPPRVVTPVVTQIFFGPKIVLNVMLPERLRTNVTRRAPSYRLEPPIVTGGAIAWHGPGVYITRPKQLPLTVSILFPPAVVTPITTQIFFGPKVNLNVMLPEIRRTRVTRRSPDYELKPPIVIGGPIAWHGPGQYLTRPKQPVPAKSVLRAPAVVTPLITQIFFGPKVTLSVMLPERQRSTVTRRRPDYELRPPVVLAENLPTQVTLVPSRRLQAKSRLSPPAVVAPVVSYGPDVHVTYSRRGAPKPRLEPPTDVIGLEDQGQVFTWLTYSRHGRPVYELKPPTVVTAVEAFYGPQTWLTYSRRGKTLPGLGRLIVVSEGPHGGVMQSLAPSSRSRAKSALRNYVVAAVVVQAYYGPAVHLTRIRLRRVQSFLRPPGIPPLARAIDTMLAPQRRGRARSVLAPPRVVFLAVEIYGPKVHLTRIKPRATRYFLRPFTIAAFDVYTGPLVTLTPSRRPVTKSALSPPTVVAPVVSYGPFQWLTYSRRGTSKPVLRPPSVVAVAVVIRYATAVHLTYSRRAGRKSFLRPPTKVFPFIARPEQVFLAPQSRGVSKSRLFPPSALKENVPLSINLAYSRRGAPRYALKPPTAVRLAVEIYGPAVELTYSRRPITRSQLLPPTVVEAFLARPTQTLLARITHPSVEHVLKPPTIVRTAVEIYGPEQWLTYSRRPITKSLLKPPTVVRRETFFTHLELTYSRRGQPKSLLKPPTVVRAAFIARPVQIRLTQITPLPVEYLLKPPSVVGAGIAFYGPVIHLTRIKHPPVHYALRVTLVAFRRPHGDVCGFDIASSFVCSLEVPRSQVSGFTSTRFKITGSSRAGSTVSGSEEPGGSVSGSDRKAT